MKKGLLLSMALVLALFMTVSFTSRAEQGKSTTPQQKQQAQTQASQSQAGWFCPYCGRMCGMRGGMMIHGGMMHGKMMHQGGMMNHGRQYMGAQQGKPMNIDQAKGLVEHYLQMRGNPNLKLGKISDNKDYFVAEITTKDGSLVDKFQIDKYRGWFRSVY